MELLTPELRQLLVDNYNANLERRNRGRDELDFLPVVKLFTPDAGATWLLTELEPEEERAFGLCDLGIGCPELGYVWMVELRGARGALGLPVERDLYFQANRPLSDYASEAYSMGRIIT